MGVPTIDTGPMTIEDFYLLVESRPAGEKWELIGGDPSLNAWPAYRHQLIVTNILRPLILADASQRDWQVLPGLAVRVDANSLPVPDILVRPNTFLEGRECDDMLVAFEILSPSTVERDLRWKRAAYAGMPTLTNYIVVAQDRVEVVVFARDQGFEELRLRSIDDNVILPKFGVTLPLADIYRGTGLS